MRGVRHNRIPVLVVEMDPMCRRVVERILGDHCEVTTSCDFCRIIALVQRYFFHTLFVDHDLSAPGAIELFRRTRVLAPNTRRLLMIGENVENLQYYLRTGLVSGFVTRTSSNQEILSAVISPHQRSR
jgi:DNA-binding NtrC family response regulator